MGYFRHHAIIVTCFNTEGIKIVRDKAQEIFGSIVSENVGSKYNGYISFAVFPDGSKEGWTQSDIGDTKRKEFLDYIEELNKGGSIFYCDFAEVQYGDDLDENKLLRYSKGS